MKQYDNQKLSDITNIDATIIKTSVSFPIALVVSSFNRALTNELAKTTYSQLIYHGIKADDIMMVRVPGAIEIPITAKRLAMKKHVKIIIALGVVIRGETNHYDYVCQQVSYGCQRVALDHDIPVIFGVLTTENEAQVWARLDLQQNHHKGIELANTAIAIHNVLQSL